MDWYEAVEQRIKLSHIKTYMETVLGLKFPDLKETGEHYRGLNKKQQRAILKAVNAWNKYMGIS